MRICMIAYAHYENDNRVMRYSESLVRRGDFVDVIALRKSGQNSFENINGVNVFRIQTRFVDEGRSKYDYLVRLLMFLFKSSAFLKKLNKKQTYQVVHVHSVPDFEVFAAWWCKLRGTRIILDIHDIVPELYAAKFNVSSRSVVFKLLTFVERLSTRFADHVIVANDIWRERLVSRSVPSGKCTSILNYPDPLVFHRPEAMEKKSKFILLYPGTISHHQGLDIAVRAFRRVMNAMANAEMHIYGEGPEKEDIRLLIDALNMQQRVWMKGRLSLRGIADVMAEADLGIVPKRNDIFASEAFSTKTLEFMALGIPLLVARTKIDEYYFNENFVMFFNPEDEIDMAEKMLTLYRDRTLRDRLTEAGLTYVRENNWEKKKHIYFGILNNLANQVR